MVLPEHQVQGMSEEPGRLPLAGEIADAFAEHEQQLAEARRALDEFVATGQLDSEAAAAARDAYERAIRLGQAPPTISGRPAEKDPNSR
jgi:hypothetical protein